MWMSLDDMTEPENDKGLARLLWLAGLIGATTGLFFAENGKLFWIIMVPHISISGTGLMLQR
jgi:hypothetical protein